MWSRIIGILFLCGLFCLGNPATGEDLPGLLARGREAFKSGNYGEAERFHRLAIETAEAGGTTAHVSTWTQTADGSDKTLTATLSGSTEWIAMIIEVT